MKRKKDLHQLKNEPSSFKLDGNLSAENLLQECKEEILNLGKNNIKPRLEVILVGDDEASKIYVNNKTKACEKIGIEHKTNYFPKEISEKNLIGFISKLNDDKKVNGILVQLPLPPHLNKTKIIEALSWEKDVDGLHPYNMGLLMLGRQKWAPCTPGGIIYLLNYYKINLEGKNCVVVGRSDIVGKPLSILLLQNNATVTVCHSKTKDLPELIKKADIIFAAMGKAAFILPEFVKEGCIIIDVGINKLTREKEVIEIFEGDEVKQATFKKRGYVLVGDVHPKAYKKASYYTPVPGGVGPMTVAMLMKNTIIACQRQLS